LLRYPARMRFFFLDKYRLMVGSGPWTRFGNSTGCCVVLTRFVGSPPPPFPFETLSHPAPEIPSPLLCFLLAGDDNMSTFPKIVRLASLLVLRASGSIFPGLFFFLFFFFFFFLFRFAANSPAVGRAGGGSLPHSWGPNAIIFYPPAFSRLPSSSLLIQAFLSLFAGRVVPSE